MNTEPQATDKLRRADSKRKSERASKDRTGALSIICSTKASGSSGSSFSKSR